MRKQRLGGRWHRQSAAEQRCLKRAGPDSGRRQLRPERVSANAPEQHLVWGAEAAAEQTRMAALSCESLVYASVSTALRACG